MRRRASSITISVCTHTSPSGCHSRLLRAADERLQLRQEPIDDAEIERERKSDRRALGLEQQLFDFAPDALGRQIVERDRSAERRASRRRRSSSNRAANCSARSTRRLSSPNVVGIDDAQAPGVEIARGRRTDRARSPVSGSTRDRVDREVAPARGVLDRQRRIALDVEALVAAAGLRLAARQRDVDVADLVDGEALADGVDAAERLEQRAQPIGRHAEHLEVESFDDPAEQRVAHPAADDERAAAGVADRRARAPRARSGSRRGHRSTSAAVGCTPRRTSARLRSACAGATTLSTASHHAFGNGYTSAVGETMHSTIARATSFGRLPRAEAARPRGRSRA